MNPLDWLRKRWTRVQREPDVKAQEALQRGRDDLQALKQDHRSVRKHADYLRQQREANHWSERVFRAWKGGPA